jgi:poly(3-hydroxybutyrate) depolymerase
MNRHSFLVAVFIISLATAGFAQNVTKSFTVNGTTHSCIWHVPSGVSKPPVVFFIHGAGGSGGGFQSETKGDVVADREKFITVYPSASSNGASGTWADMSGTGNYPFFLAVLDTLDARYQIDRNRVYMTGFSQGGFISFVAACSFSDIFAAVAPVSGHAGKSCTLKRPVSVYMTFGSQEGAASFFQDRDAWLKFDSCPSTPTRSTKSGITRLSYGPCTQGTYVIVDSIGGQGHQWPTKQNQAEEVWAFFKQFSLSGTTAISQQTRNVAREDISATYSSGIVRLQGAGEKCRVRVIDTKGRLVSAAAAAQRQFAFKDKPGGVYVVMVNGNDRPVTLRMVIP